MSRPLRVRFGGITALQGITSQLPNVAINKAVRREA